MKNSKKDFYLLWFAIMLFYFFQYIIRILPNIAIIDIMRTFRLNANQFAVIGALYLYIYSFVQIPIGILSDKIGISKLVLISMGIFFIGTYFFVSTADYRILQISRVLQGLGSACTFLCALKLISDKFPKHLVSSFTGITAAIGSFGAMFAGKPTSYLIDKYGMKDAVYFLSSIEWIAFVIIVIVCWREYISKSSNEHCDTSINAEKIDWKSLFSVLKDACCNKILWVYAIISVGLYAPASVIADFWSTGFFMTKYGIQHDTASFTITLFYIGALFGSFIIPMIIKPQYKRIALIFVIIITFSLLSIILYTNIVSFLEVIVILMGFITGGEMLCFVGVMEITNKSNSGIVIGLMNTINMIGSAITQQLVGVLMDMKWIGKVDEFGIRVYQAEDYSFSMSIINALLIFGLFLTIKYLKQDTKNYKGV